LLKAKREFEEVFMVEVLIEIFLGQAENRPKDYERAVAVKREVRGQITVFGANGEVRSKPKAHIVRDV
jgi:hypothetical protein